MRAERGRNTRRRGKKCARIYIDQEREREREREWEEVNWSL
jgi:hypothetical protein